MDKAEENKRKIKMIIIIISLIIIATISIIIYNTNNSKKIENKLIKEKYEKITDKIYNKTIENGDTEITYTYNINNKEFSKTINSQNENINLLYTNNNIRINYSYSDKFGCRITQRGTYTEKDFNCSIIKKIGSCKSKCDVMFKQAKQFTKELKKYR